MTDVNDDIRAATQELSKIAPAQMPDTFDLAEVGFALLKLWTKTKITRTLTCSKFMR